MILRVSCFTLTEASIRTFTDTNGRNLEMASGADVAEALSAVLSLGNCGNPKNLGSSVDGYPRTGRFCQKCHQNEERSRDFRIQIDNQKSEIPRFWEKLKLWQHSHSPARSLDLSGVFSARSTMSSRKRSTLQCREPKLAGCMRFIFNNPNVQNTKRRKRSHAGE